VELEGGRRATIDPSRTGPLIWFGIVGSLLLTIAVTWLAVAGERLAPAFMTDLRSSTTVFTAVWLAQLVKVK